MRGKTIKIIKNDFERNKCKKFNKLLYSIKSDYKVNFKNDLKKIQIEKERLEVELECIKSPSTQYALTIGLFAVGTGLDNLIETMAKDLRFIVAIAYCFTIIVVLGKLFISEARKEKAYRCALVALKKLEEEIREEEIEKQLKPKLIRVQKI